MNTESKSKVNARFLTIGMLAAFLAAACHPDTPASIELEKAKASLAEAREAEIEEGDRHALHLIGFDETEPLRALHLIITKGDSPELIRCMIERHVNLDGNDHFGMTPLIWAVRSGKPGNLKALIVGGADVNHQDDYGRTALIYAAAAGSAEMVAILLVSGADKDIQDSGGWAAEQYAAAGKHENVIEVLKEY